MHNYRDRFHFAACPRTGSTWFIKAAAIAGLGEAFKAKLHDPFPARAQRLASLRVSLVRHPCDWLASYWASIHPGRVGVREVDALPVAMASFDSFIKAYLRSMPGQVGRIFASYNADTYLRLEDMPWAAVELFETIGVQRGQTALVEKLDPQNVTRQELRPHWDAKLRRRVLEAEQEMCERYDY